MHTPPTSDDVVILVWDRLREAAEHLNRLLLSLPSESREKIVWYWRSSTKLLVFAVLWQSLPAAALLLLYGAFRILGHEAPIQIPQSIAFIAALLLILIPAGNVIHWFFTVYVLTEERVFVQRGIVARKKLQAPISKVETATLTSQGPIHKLLNIGSVQLSTASKQGNLLFANVDGAHQVETTIIDFLRTREKEGERLRKSEIVDALGRHMVEEKPIDEILKPKTIDYPTIVWHKHPYVLIIGISAPFLAGLLTAAPPMLLSWFAPALYQQLGIVHWFALSAVVSGVWTLGHLAHTLARPVSAGGRQEPLALRRALWAEAGYGTQFFITAVSLLFILSGMLLTVALLARDWLGLRLPGPWIPLWVPLLLYQFFLAAWLGLRALDWWNDRYVLTPNDITDVMRIPMVYERRTKAPLAKVQDVRANVTFFGRLLDYGDVIVETAGGGQNIVFPSILHPLRVQDSIFQYMEAQHQRDRANQQVERRNELTDWLDAYRALTFPSCNPPVRWPDPTRRVDIEVQPTILNGENRSGV